MRHGIALGSNLGDRLTHLREAHHALEAMHRGAPDTFLASSIYESKPVDCDPDTPTFYNAVVELESDADPELMLARLQSLERESGRPDRRSFHAPRTLDLDLLYCDDEVRSGLLLTLPHPRWHERLFVLLPLADIRPDLILPGEARRVAECLQAQQKKEEAGAVRQLEENW